MTAIDRLIKVVEYRLRWAEKMEESHRQASRQREANSNSRDVEFALGKYEGGRASALRGVLAAAREEAKRC